MVALHRERPRLHRVLFEEAPRPPALRRRVGRLSLEARGAVAAYLEVRGAREQPALAARLVVQVVETVTHELVLRPDDGVTVEAYVDETVALLVGYLSR